MRARTASLRWLLTEAYDDLTRACLLLPLERMIQHDGTSRARGFGYDRGAMAAPKGDLTASMAILGLLVRQPDTASGLRQRLAREYPHGRWSRSIAYGDVRNLARQGLIRRVLEGEKDSEDLYEALPSGIAALKRWLREAAKAPPPLRDVMHLWLEHSTEAELPELLRVLGNLEDIARAEYGEASNRLGTERALGRLGPPDGSDWRGRMRDAVLSEVVLMCGHRIVRLRKLREKLENTSRELHEQRTGNG
jgi:DNA-binding PadR family transcriptional regulator